LQTLAVGASLPFMCCRNNLCIRGEPNSESHLS